MTAPRWSLYGSGLVALFSNAALESSLIFLALFAQGLGASQLQVGVIGGAYGVAYFLASLFFGRLSDIKGRLLFVRLGLGLATLSLALQAFVGDPLALTLVRALVGLGAGIAAPALLAYNFEAGGSTGRFASLSSLGWLLGDMVALFVHDYGILFMASAAASGLAFLVALFISGPESRGATRLTTFGVGRRNTWVYLPFFLRHTGANMVWVVFPLFLAALGASHGWIATLSAINTGGQFLAMMFIERFRESRLFHLGFVLSFLTFLAYALAGNYLQLVPVQALLAVAWSSLYVGALLLLLKGNKERATATGILLSTANISAAIGPFFGGLVAQIWGYRVLTLLAAGLCLAGLAVARALRPRDLTPSLHSGQALPSP